jgi:tRNA-(ms[2]io[6]A)-hydroxylase
MFCLKTSTDPEWAKKAIQDLDAVLVDHAHCEMKAATNALSLVVRHPADLALVRDLVDLAREELDHFRRVVGFLERRGLKLGPPEVDEYAAELRRAQSALPAWGMPAIVDRLLVGALIEARSCERFKLLLDVLPPDHPHDLKIFYEELFSAEARHYRMYCDLAVQAARNAMPGVEMRIVEIEVDKRLEILSDHEGAIVKTLADRDRRSTVHG